MVAEAEHTQAEWMGRVAMRLASQVSAMEVEEVEQAAAPTVETRGGSSSEVVSVASSARKVSSDAVGLSNRANRLPEGLGTGRGGHGGRVRHHQVEGLGAGGMASRHQRCMRHLQEGRGHGQMHVWDQHSLAQGWHGQRKPTETAGSSAVAAVDIETMKSKSAISDSLP